MIERQSVLNKAILISVIISGCIKETKGVFYKLVVVIIVIQNYSDNEPASINKVAGLAR